MDSPSKPDLVGADDLDHLYNTTASAAQIGESLAQLRVDETGSGLDFAEQVLMAQPLTLVDTPYKRKETKEVVESILSEITEPLTLGLSLIHI